MPRHHLLAVLLAVATTTAVAAPATYTIDPGHTDVIAQWSHFGFSHPVAHFGQVDGTIVYDADNVAASRVEVRIPLSGMNTHVPDLDTHLRGADFFDAGKYPDITFRSTKVERMADGRLRITGDLTLHGVTKPVVLDATLNKAGPHPMGGAPTIGFDASATLRRSEFGIGKYAPNVSDEIGIRITTEATAPKTGKAG